MAENPIDPKDSEKIKQNLEDIVRKSSEMEFSFLRTRDASKALLESLTSTTELVKRIEVFGTQIKNSFIDVNNLASRLGTEYIKIEQVEKRRKENQGLQNQLQTMQNQLIEEYNKKYAGVLQTTEDGRKITAKAVTLEQAKNSILERVKKNGEQSLGDQEKQFYILTQYIESLKQQEDVLNGISKSVESGNKEFTKMAVKGTALKKIFDQLSFIPILSSFMRFDIIADKFLVSKRAGFAELGSQIKTIVTSPMFLLAMGILAAVAAMKALIKAAFDFEKSVVTISNNLGITRDAAVGILDTFREISAANLVLVKGLDSAFLSVKNQAAATAELQEILGTNAMFTTQMIQSQILLTKQMGLSKEEAAGIQKLSLLSGKSADDILQNAISQNKTAISYKKIISDISKVNAEISVMYKNNPELIAKAVIEANKLGMSLEDTQKIAKSLLDFETSIAGELEAELLTGQRFNFEKARALALDGKSVEAAKELVDQMGGLNGLTRLNVIQRERLAASIGLSAEELTKSAREQEVLNKLGFQNRTALEEQYEFMRQRNDLAGMAALKAEAEKTEQGKVLLQDIARANLQQRFQESVERIKQIFTEIAAGPLIKMLEGIAKFLQDTTTLKIIMGALVGLAVSLATAIAVATGGLSLVAGGLAGLATYSALSGTAEVETPTVAAAGAVSRVSPAQGGLQDLQSRMSTITSPNQIGGQNMVSAVSPSMSSRPEVPYSAPSNTSPQPVSQASSNNQSNTIASNSDNKSVIQINNVLEVDGIALSVSQKKLTRNNIA